LRIPEKYQAIAGCTYALSVGFVSDERIQYSPNWATAIAISDHYLITAANAMQWITPFRGHSEHGTISLKISAIQNFDDPVIRTQTRLRKPHEGDLEVQVYAFADKHDPEKLYVLQDLDDFPAEMDLVVLYSPKKLSKNTYPKPQKSASTRSQSTQIGLLAYHGRESGTILRDYPNTLRADLGATIKKLIPNWLTLVQGVHRRP